jgi:hypothetical protein
MLKVNGGDRRPCIAHGAKENLQNQFDDARFGGGEQTARRQLIHAFTKAPKKTVQRTEHQFGLDHHHRVTAQGTHANGVDRQRGFEALEVVTKTHNLHTRGVDARAGAQNLEHAQSELANEALIDHVQGHDVDAQAAVFSREVVLLGGYAQVEATVDRDGATVDTVDQSGEFFAGQEVLVIGHATNLVVSLLDHEGREIDLFDATEVFKLLQHGVHFGADLLCQVLAERGLFDLGLRDLTQNVKGG